MQVGGIHKTCPPIGQLWTWAHAISPFIHAKYQLVYANAGCVQYEEECIQSSRLTHQITCDNLPFSSSYGGCCFYTSISQLVTIRQLETDIPLTKLEKGLWSNVLSFAFWQRFWSYCLPVLASVHYVPITSLAGSCSGCDICHFKYPFKRLRWGFSQKSKTNMHPNSNGIQ